MAVDWLPWAPLGAALLHIFEEFVFPGGFPAWYRRYRVDVSRITPRFLFVINAVLVAACLELAMFGRTPPEIFYWMSVTAVLCSNGM